MHAKIQNSNIIEYPIVNLYQRLPQISLPADLTNDSALPDGFVYVHSEPAPFYNPDTHKLSAIMPRFKEGKWRAGYEAVPLDQEELEQVKQRKELEVRDKRNRLLLESDWTQVSDAPVDKQLWADYRQALRSITDQPEFPFNLQWPETPQ
jgi:hypothetical protein